MAGSLTQYPKQILVGNTLIAHKIKGAEASNELSISSSDDAVEITMNIEASGGIALSATNITLPQHLNYNPVKTDGDGKITS